MLVDYFKSIPINAHWDISRNHTDELRTKLKLMPFLFFKIETIDQLFLFVVILLIRNGALKIKRRLNPSYATAPRLV